MGSASDPQLATAASRLAALFAPEAARDDWSVEAQLRWTFECGAVSVLDTLLRSEDVEIAWLVERLNSALDAIEEAVEADERNLRQRLSDSD